MRSAEVKVLEDYLHALYLTHASGAGVTETSHYAALATLLNEIGKTLKPRVRCLISLQDQGAGLPDMGLFTPDQFARAGAEPRPGQLPSRGAIEVKGPGEDAHAVAAGEQVRRYLETYRQVLVTNYREFVLAGYDEQGRPRTLESYQLAESEAALWALAAHPQATAKRHALQLVEYLKRALLSRAPLIEPEALAWYLASYAREARARVEGRHDLPALAAVREALEEALGLKFQGEKGEHFFRSTLVQTLFYGIFSAWVLWDKDHPRPDHAARFEWREAHWYLHVPMIRGLFQQIASPQQLGPLALVEVLDWAGETLHRVDRASFFERFDADQAVQYFYEPFLQAFDPELRKELGVWYTPPEIVRYMVERVDRVLRSELRIVDGLADPSVYVLDPCCGTGAYLVEVLRRIRKTLEEKGADALVAQDLKKAAMERVFGFELLPAPFVIAHLQLGLLLQMQGAALSDEHGERAGVFLTNALTGWEPPQGPKQRLPFIELEQERDAAEKVKQEVPILVILGNPPYNGFAGVSPEEEGGLVEPYKQGLREWGITKNYLDDLYVRFFRLAERRIAEKTGRGVVCYISNFSYLREPSFVVMRQRLLDGFDAIWVDCMNGDSRETGKRTPDDRPDPSVFSTERSAQGIQVGTAVTLFVRKGRHDGAREIRFREFWGVTKRRDLVAALDEDQGSCHYADIRPGRESRFAFRPSVVTAGYDSWPGITGLCAARPLLGLNDNRGQGLCAIRRAELEQRMQVYFDTGASMEEVRALHAGLATNAADFDAEQTRSRLQRESAYSGERIVRMWFKPFDLRWAYIERRAGLWNRVRPELLDQMWDGNTFLLARCHAPRSGDGAALFHSRRLSDQHAMHKDAYFIPLRIRPRGSEEDGRLRLVEDAMAPVANLSPAARGYLASLDIGDPDQDAEAAALIWMHALAIAYSPAYLAENADGVQRDWPHIPLPDTSDALLASAKLGRRIAEFLDMERGVPDVTVGAVRRELREIAVASRTDEGPLQPTDLRVTAGWGHAGIDGATMPGAGRCVQRAYFPDEAAAIAAGAEALGLAPQEARARLGETARDIYLNDVAYWRNVPERVWSYTVGGYQVMKKWLSYREAGLLGRALTPDEVREVTHMARRIAAILLLEPALDANYARAKTAAYAWRQPE